jgi:hypothetical protein
MAGTMRKMAVYLGLVEDDLDSDALGIAEWRHVRPEREEFCQPFLEIVSAAHLDRRYPGR